MERALSARLSLASALLAITAGACAHGTADDRRAPSGVYGSQTVGNTTITSMGGTTAISGPGGIMVITPDTDQFSGSWKDGLTVDINHVLAGSSVPDKIVIKNFTIRMSDGNEFRTIAISPGESEQNAETLNRLAYERAKTICSFVLGHPNVYSWSAASRKFAGDFIDLNNLEEVNGQKHFKVEHYPMLSGLKYFDEIVCSITPREYR